MKTIFTFAASLLFSFVLLFAQEETSVHKENLGFGVNSRYDDLAPKISPDGKIIYFCRSSHPENLGDSLDQDIWYTELDETGKWSFAQNIGAPMNNEYPNFVQSVSPDGNTLILGGGYEIDGEIRSGAIMVHRSATGWSAPVKLKIEDYYNNSGVVNYYLTNDGNTLLMSLERDDTYGKHDIYYTRNLGEDGWSAPVNLGPNINSEKYDMSPFLASDGVSLYFSSNRKGGFGGFDVYVSRRLDDSWEKWSDPENLGQNVNTPGDDKHYIIPASGEQAYFSSSENSYGGYDIFKIALPKKVKPKPVVLIYGKVLNAKTKEPIEAKVLYEILPDGIEAGTARSNPSNGKYKITLPVGREYGFRAEAKGFISVNDNLNTIGITEYTEIERNLELAPIEVGQIVRLNNIFFDYDKATLREESFPELKRVVDMLNKNANIYIEISGHTDNAGSDEYNRVLSENRAQSVADYIIDMDIDAERVTYKGYGESAPVAENDTEEGRQMNRRVEFKILKK